MDCVVGVLSVSRQAAEGWSCMMMVMMHGGAALSRCAIHGRGIPYEALPYGHEGILKSPIVYRT
jgi:hypothetical protein